MGLYEATLTGVYFNQLIINRWNYQSNDAAVPLPSLALAEGLGSSVAGGVYPVDKMLGIIMASLCPEFILQQLTCLNIYDPTDFFQVAFVIPFIGGATPTDPLSPAFAFGFRTTLTRRDVARGTKRFVGVSEQAVGDGGVIEPGTMIALGDVAAAMTEALTVTVDAVPIIFTPVVLGKQRYNPDTGLAAADGRAYRYFPVEADQEDKVSAGIVWQPYDHIRTQVSRQYGHGR